ncbi:Lrp/AsnC family transcriptional regulator [Candidatus Woesearchaeota archaeon]|jgi:Lrp/AsnC family transcriptional regulator, regulator for asnA, asnC and gidA|nr:Lrp/AsnC family transcriptional regulator [Candidatus Woesearchaeota archaeon]MBT4368026.1 Lrp/AsnC family transcriptional regulator [Candidatus Woesearchaeota archaeon]MBT4712514.1 Lrp/AsnC family transcriptional regulator [Candidatus Woesearchaeota archaeon]MBT6639427.1 Lrp/AsnC family transcriptional regulator [Candidatus Woesearchaeota archaeon]MBT7133599.1 Lrp/AsnC family transcriptional regulator [Candidatus Woesearchaeota archaeon]
MPVKTSLKSRAIDEIDKKILMILQDDGREQLTSISKKVGLSIDSVHKRIKEMMRKDIVGITTSIDPRKIGYDLIADNKIRLKNVSAEERTQFIRYLQQHNRVIDIFALMGDYDLTCVLIAKDSNELEKLITEIRQKFRDLIDEWKSLLVLKTYKIDRYDL